MSQFKYIKRDQQRVLSQENIYELLRSHLVTEKTTRQEALRQYFFSVAAWANKFFVKKAIETLFNVRVDHVNMICLKGKAKRFRGRIGYRSDQKKAIVCLAKGYRLNLDTKGLV